MTIAELAQALRNAPLTPVKGNTVNHNWLAEGKARADAFIGPVKPGPIAVLPVARPKVAAPGLEKREAERRARQLVKTTYVKATGKGGK